MTFLRAVILIFCAGLSVAVSAQPSEGGSLGTGPEYPMTVRGEWLPVPAAHGARFVAGHDLIFWNDRRAGGPIYYGRGSFEEEFIVGAPLEPFDGFRVELVGVVPVSDQLLAVAIGSAPTGDYWETFGFYVLPLDLQGQPLRETPERVWEPGSDARVEVASNGPSVLLVWTEQGGSLRTLLLDENGNLLDWPAPAEDFAARIESFDVAAVGERFLVAISVREAPDAFDGWIVWLDKNGDAAGIQTGVFERTGSTILDLAGGEGSALLTWVENGLRSVVIPGDGAVGSVIELDESSGTPWQSTLVSGRDAGGWYAAWSPAEPALPLIRYVEISDQGEVVHDEEVALDGTIARISGSEADPRLGVSMFENGRYDRLILLGLSDGEWERSVVSSLEPQRLRDVAVSHDRIGVVINGGSDETSGSIALFEPLTPATTLPLGISSRRSSIASDGDHFLLVSVESLSYSKTRIIGRWLDESGVMSAPFEIYANDGSWDWVYVSPVTGWTGTHFLSIWSTAYPYKASVIPGDLMISSVFGTASISTEVFRGASAMARDLLCDDDGCLVGWTEVDPKSCPFPCERSSGSLIASFSKHGELRSQPLRVGDIYLEMQLARRGRMISLFYESNLHRLSVQHVDPELQNVSDEQTIAELDPLSAFDAIGFGAGAIVAWNRQGDIHYAFVDGDGSVAAQGLFASSEWAESNPHLVKLLGQTWLLYERIDPEAGYVPRLFARRVFELERRRSIQRR